jgi:hypothetical protein
MTETTFEKKCEILAELWLEYKDDETFEDFVAYNDLGLPLAYCLANDIISFVGLSDTAKSFVNEAFSLLLDGLEMEDEGFENLDQILCE